MPTSGGQSIAFYCGPSIEPWGPASLLAGIGGSEEALIHLSRQLARLGFRVAVYGSPPGDVPLLDEGVRWLPLRAFDPDRPGDIFVSWRSPDHVQLAGRYRFAFHWLHNRLEWGYPEDVAARVDRIILVSEHHRTDAGFAGVDPRKLYVSRNGLDEAFLRPAGENEPHRVIYASCPARGLIPLLEMWPAVRRRVPDAALDVYYGFTAIYDDMAKHFPGLTYIKSYVLQLLEKMAPHGVTFHGMVGQDRLAEAFARAGVWAYPTECLESSCITAMKALAMGCLPVTSGYGVLPETLGGRDLGPVHPQKRITQSRWRLLRYRSRLVRAMKVGGRDAWRKTRLEWAAWARARYRWRTIAEEWCRLFAEVAEERRSSSPIESRGMP